MKKNRFWLTILLLVAFTGIVFAGYVYFSNKVDITVDVVDPSAFMRLEIPEGSTSPTLGEIYVGEQRIITVGAYNLTEENKKFKLEVSFSNGDIGGVDLLVNYSVGMSEPGVAYLEEKIDHWIVHLDNANTYFELPPGDEPIYFYFHLKFNQPTYYSIEIQAIKGD